jgi:hypothetical protein
MPRGPLAASVAASRVAPANSSAPSNEHALFSLNGNGRGIFGNADAAWTVFTPTGWDDAFVYAPTDLPAGGSCIELTAIHWKTTTFHEPTHSLGIWDWCNQPAGPFVAYWDMTVGSFQSMYLRSYTDDFGESRQLFWFQVDASHPAYASGSYDCWTAYLYNYNTGVWDQLRQICGTPQVATYGWSMYESRWMQLHYSSSCLSYPSIRAGNLQILTTGATWAAVDSTNSTVILEDGACWLNSTYTFVTGASSGSTAWYGWTPNN